MSATILDAANILAPVLVELTPVIVNQLKPGGIYITSGIYDDKEEMVKEAVQKPGWNFWRSHIRVNGYV